MSAYNVTSLYQYLLRIERMLFRIFAPKASIEHFRLTFNALARAKRGIGAHLAISSRKMRDKERYKVEAGVRCLIFISRVSLARSP